MKATKIISACAVLAALASCSNDHVISQPGAEDTPSPIRFETSVGGMKTKAVNDATELQDIQFKDNEIISIFLREHLADGEIAIKEYINPLVGTTSSSGTTHQINFTTPPTFPANGRGVDCLAIYPQKDTTSTTNIDNNHSTFTVHYNQSDQSNYRASDLMWAYTGNTKKSSGEAVKLVFTHLLSKIMVKVKCDASVDNRVLDHIYVDLLNTCNTIDIVVPNVAQSTSVAQSGDMTDLTVKIADNPNPQNANAFYLGKAEKDGNNDYTKQVSAIIVPQTIAKDSQFFKIKLNNGSDDYAIYTYKVTNDAGLKFEGGKKYEYTITLKAGGIDVESVKINAWGDGVNNGSGDATLN